MNLAILILISLWLLLLGLGLIFLGILALKSPQKIVNSNLKLVRGFKFLKNFHSIQKNYIDKSENGNYAENWRKGGIALILMGIIFMYAFISYLIL